MISSTVLRFTLVGLVNTAVGYGVILLLHYGLGIDPVPANAGGYLSGLLLSYALNRRYTFASRRPHGQALPRFGMAAAGCFALNLLVLQVGLAVLALPVALAQALAVGSYSVAFYFANRWLVFRA